jgi:hypothetical protein
LITVFIGVILSQNAKWNEHLENMITNITKHLGILWKLKFSLNRSNLEKMYLVYIRPLFEYACEVCIPHFILKIIGVFCGISALIVFPNLSQHINTPIL